MSERYDVVIIGAGPAGYVAAIRCAQLGLRTACIDKWLSPEGKPSLGGTCLNAGCVSSKALLDSSELYQRAQTEFAEHGIKAAQVSVDLAAMQARKTRLVHRLTANIATLFEDYQIQWLPGHGRLLENNQVEFTPHEADGPQMLAAKNVILASGSRPMELEAAPIDGERIVDSTGALSFQEVPRRLGIIGAGVIGVELGSIWSRLGAKVTLLEARDGFLPMVDKAISQEAHKRFKQQGLDVRLGARVVSTRVTSKQVTVHYQIGEEDHELKVDKLIVAVGRQPYSEHLFALETGLLLDERGFIHVDEYGATNLPGVYAIGDVVRGPMLAHKGSQEGIAVAEAIAQGKETTVKRDNIPWVIYTEPEISWAGRTEEALRDAGIEVRVGTFPFAASARANAMDGTEGLVKVVADANTDQLLGVHIIGPWASELIAEAVLAMEFAASSEDLARTIHAYPSLAEALHEAALDVDNRAIHVAGR
ncbi:dihydrolipoamide dehydrogenase [Nitrosococcus halophilus Nc 4]|uniref:Dihydrolipoyl dehydrogenase n=1 Tax=Nitrosococcus halophilus (strain Nc4) TaxID=472759 RepID=D5C4P8_NITHN|nr:dihydrolipoyl dehydrogenase [Nitrosococcus halophilus]ADE13321.1 dihydrolipoamide dehydrogenase [Nitrosococcus halophilus Nc 4]